MVAANARTLVEAWELEVPRHPEDHVQRIAREMRIPLTPLMLAVEAAAARPGLAGRDRALFQLMARNLARFTALVEELEQLERPGKARRPGS